MLAPRLLVATSPRTLIAAVVSRVVVVLPLVPEISTISRPAARFASRFGSIMRPIRPPITEPSPRPVARERAAALRVTDVASLARSGSFFVVISLSRGSGNRIGGGPDPIVPRPADGVRIRRTGMAARTVSAPRHAGAANDLGYILHRSVSTPHPSTSAVRTRGLGAQKPIYQDGN